MYKTFLVFSVSLVCVGVGVGVFFFFFLQIMCDSRTIYGQIIYIVFFQLMVLEA